MRLHFSFTFHFVFSESKNTYGGWRWRDAVQTSPSPSPRASGDLHPARRSSDRHPPTSNFLFRQCNLIDYFTTVWFPPRKTRIDPREHNGIESQTGSCALINTGLVAWKGNWSVSLNDWNRWHNERRGFLMGVWSATRHRSARRRTYVNSYDSSTVLKQCDCSKPGARRVLWVIAPDKQSITRHIAPRWSDLTYFNNTRFLWRHRLTCCVSI